MWQQLTVTMMVYELFGEERNMLTGRLTAPNVSQSRLKGRNAGAWRIRKLFDISKLGHGLSSANLRIGSTERASFGAENLQRLCS